MVDASATASWTAQVAARLQFFPLFRIEIPLIVPSATVLFLAGALLLRAGALTDTPAGVRIRRRLMVVGFGVALPLNALTAFGSLTGSWSTAICSRRWWRSASSPR